MEKQRIRHGVLRRACFGAMIPVLTGLLSLGFFKWPFFKKEAPSVSAQEQVSRAASQPVLTLGEAFRLAMRNHEAIEVAYLEQKEGGILPLRALSAILPVIESEASVTYPEEEIGFAGSTIVPSPLSEANITLTQPLFQGQLLPGYLGAKNSAEAGEQTRLYTVRQILFEVAQAYFNILRYQHLLEVSQEASRLAEEQLRILSDRYNAGQAPKNDFLRAQVAVSRASRSLMESTNNLQLSYSILSSQIGIPADVLRETKVTEPEESSPVTLEGNDELQKYREFAEMYRNDLKSLKEQVDAQKWVVRQRLASFLPTAELELVQSWVDPESFSRRNDFWTAMFTVSFPLFEGGRRTMDVQQERYKLEQAELRYERLKKEVLLQVEQAWLQCKTAKSHLEAVLKERELSQENYEVLLERYDSGQATSLDVTDAFAELVASRTQAVTQLYDYQLAILDLLREAGLFGEVYVNPKVKQEVF